MGIKMRQIEDRSHKVVVFEEEASLPFYVVIQCNHMASDRLLGRFIEDTFAIEYAELVATRLKCEWINKIKA